jgi:hypothetical protein
MIGAVKGLRQCLRVEPEKDPPCLLRSSHDVTVANMTSKNPQVVHFGAQKMRCCQTVLYVWLETGDTDPACVDTFPRDAVVVVDVVPRVPSQTVLE